MAAPTQMTPELTAMVTGLHEKFIEFMNKYKVFTIDDFCWAARNDKSRVDSDIIDPANAQFSDVLGFTEKVAIRKAWWAAHLKFTKQLLLRSNLLNRNRHQF